MRKKLILSLSLITLTLLLSCAIAFYEFAKVAGDMALVAESPQQVLQIQEMYSRALLPAVVSLGITIILIVLLGFFISSYYIKPILRMQRGLDAYMAFDRSYNVTFDGNDNLHALNKSITQITIDNGHLRSRIAKRESQAQQSVQK
ncbi:MAG: hypothetical protein MJY62_03790 [Bacteroidales bacterium]|nr:hypothetical protein [Bacteroidales bacterium]